ncbi:MAG: class I SAM-dependent methyltransferase [Flavobacteriales bacterium]|nr:hypothetical protein [Flavobacteriales bacterium]MCC6576090.1 class I SAM-dependent methyltransferase [Flavobacteriales bacterium]NUQ15715.1 class I SAM-dependent methyltransferase [Flavobacteriales bacterium]
MQEKEWDSVAATFEEEVFNVPANDRRGLIEGAVVRHAKPGATATDLGCGVGRTLPLLARHYARVNAVDISSACLAVAREHCAGLANIRYVHADLSNGRKGFPQTDLVLCINTWLSADPVLREGLVSTTCRSVVRGGHLVLVVPAVGSVRLTTLRQVQLNRAQGMDPVDAERRALDQVAARGLGVFLVDSVPTKHFSPEELEVLLSDRGFALERIEKLEYGWDTEFLEPPGWMKAPYPWDWFVEARRVR